MEQRLGDIHDMLEEMGVPLNGVVLKDAIKELALSAGYHEEI